MSKCGEISVFMSVFKVTSIPPNAGGHNSPLKEGKNELFGIRTHVASNGELKEKKLDINNIHRIYQVWLQE